MRGLLNLYVLNTFPILQTHPNEYDDILLPPAVHNLPTPVEDPETASPTRRRALWFMAITNVAVVIALGSLCTWHAKLITRGETSVEAHINEAERKRLLQQKRIYINPYNFGTKKNWKLFLGLVRGRQAKVKVTIFYHLFNFNLLQIFLAHCATALVAQTRR